MEQIGGFIAFLIVVFFLLIVLCMIWKCLSEIWLFLFSSPIPEYHPNIYPVMQPYVPESHRRKLHKPAVALDTERVGAGTRGHIDMVGRVAVVDEDGRILIDKYVKPLLPVTDYRTHYSGLCQRDFWNAEDFDTVQQKVIDVIQGRILVGHDLEADLKCLKLQFPRNNIRDTAFYWRFRELFRNSHEKPSLKNLALRVLGRSIKMGLTNPVEDARAAMDLYLKVAEDWEAKSC